MAGGEVGGLPGVGVWEGVVWVPWVSLEGVGASPSVAAAAVVVEGVGVGDGGAGDEALCPPLPLGVISPFS